MKQALPSLFYGYGGQTAANDMFCMAVL